MDSNNVNLSTVNTAVDNLWGSLTATTTQPIASTRDSWLNNFYSNNYNLNSIIAKALSNTDGIAVKIKKEEPKKIKCSEIEGKPSFYIEKIKVINDSEGEPKVTKVLFYNGKETKATVQSGDVFSLSYGVLLCMTKMIYGKEINPSSLEEVAQYYILPFKKYSKEITNGIERYYKEFDEKEKEEKKKEERRRIEENRAAKRARYKARRHDRYVREQAEILVKAREMADETPAKSGGSLTKLASALKKKGSK